MIFIDAMPNVNLIQGRDLGLLFVMDFLTGLITCYSIVLLICNVDVCNVGAWPNDIEYLGKGH